MNELIAAGAQSWKRSEFRTASTPSLLPEFSARGDVDKTTGTGTDSAPGDPTARPLFLNVDDDIGLAQILGELLDIAAQLPILFGEGIAPIPPEPLACSTSARMRWLYPAAKWRRLACATTSGSARVAATAPMKKQQNSYGCSM